MDAVLFALWMPVMPLVAGLWSLTSPFSLACLLFASAYGWVLSRLVGARLTVFAVSIGSMALWMSIMSTERMLPQTYPPDIHAPMSVAGFPFAVFSYPFPPMGGDVPPLAQWLPFFAAYAFWLLAGLAAAPAMARLFPEKRLRLRYVLLPAIAVTLLGFGHTLLKFD